MQSGLGAVMRVAAVVAVVLLLCSFAFVRRGGPDLERYPTSGIDVSHHQGEIDWGQVAATDVEFAFIKATEGRDFSDPRFAFNWQQSKSAGVARGAYHFFTFCSGGLDQARHFLAVVPPEPDAMTPAVDIEFSGNCTSYEDLAKVREELAIFLTEVEAAWGRKPILYLTFRSKLQIVDERFDGYPVWLRNVFWNLPDDAVSFWTVWQYADDGEVAGIEGPVDRNVLNPKVSVAMLGLDESG